MRFSGDKDKFLYEINFYLKFKNTRILLGIWISNFPGNLEFSKIEKQNSLYNSKNLMKNIQKIFENPKLILKIPKFTWKFLYSYTEQNSSNLRILDKNAFQKGIYA